MPRPRFSSAGRPLGRAILALASALWLAVLAPGVAAHVNRTAGAYTIVVMLVEEPVFQDNHAGFEFFVRRDGAAIAGLEQTVRAQANGHGEQVDLVVSPLNGRGVYVIDHAATGDAFDPRGGGAWTLTLTGSIEQTGLDATFPVTFPGYPRVVVENPGAAAAGATGQVPSPGEPSLLIPATSAVVVLGGLVLFVLARRYRWREATRRRGR
jgi:hypothetical protein